MGDTCQRCRSEGAAILTHWPVLPSDHASSKDLPQALVRRACFRAHADNNHLGTHAHAFDE